MPKTNRYWPGPGVGIPDTVRSCGLPCRSAWSPPELCCRAPLCSRGEGGPAMGEKSNLRIRIQFLVILDGITFRLKIEKTYIFKGNSLESIIKIITYYR